MRDDGLDGMRAQVYWRDGKLEQARLRTAGPVTRDVEYAGRRRSLAWQAGETRVLLGVDWVRV